MARLDEMRDLLMAEMPKTPVVESEESVKLETAENPVDESPEVVSGSPDEPVEEKASEDESPVIDDADEIVTIASLAADLHVDPEKMYGMSVNLETGDTMTIGEMKDIVTKSHKQELDMSSKEETFAEREDELDRKESELYAQTENVQPAELIKAEADVQRVYADFASVDWPKLEATNPGEAALKRQKLMEQQQIATFNRDQITQRMEITRKEIQGQREVAAQQQAARAVQQLQSLIPEWRDEAVYVREREHMVNHLVDSGIAEQTIRGIGDPTLIKYLRDSLSRDKKIEAAKPHINAPKVLKASAVQSKGRGKAQADKRFIANATKSKDTRTKTEAQTLVLMQALGRR